MERQYFFHIGRYKIPNIHSTERWYVGNEITGKGAVVSVPCPQGQWKGDHSDISKVCYLRCKKAINRSAEGRLTFVREATGLRRDYLPWLPCS